eukprot:57877-Rhodomonas_salina.3
MTKSDPDLVGRSEILGIIGLGDHERVCRTVGTLSRPTRRRHRETTASMHCYPESRLRLKADSLNDAGAMATGL